MTQQRLTERPRGRHGKYTFGASANKHTVGQSKSATTEWRRDVHAFQLSVLTPTTGEKDSEQLVGSPGQGFIRQIRRVAFHGAIACPGTTGAQSLDALAGVVEIVLGLAESISAFNAVLADSEAAGMFRRYVTFAQGAGAFKFWIPSGFNQMGQGEPVQGGGPWQLYVGVRCASVVVGTAAASLRLAGLISTQEKEERVYS